MNPMRVGFYSILATSVGILVLPVVVIAAGCIVNHVSLGTIMHEPESRGFTALYCVVAFVLHLPMAAILAVFAHAIRSDSSRIVRDLSYVLALLAMILSAVFYARWFIGFPYVKYLPAILYSVVILPLLTWSLLAHAKTQRAMRVEYE